jgi:triacylglycerol esterase/lipase EstA (alpha/beta hydrolase family)
MRLFVDRRALAQYLVLLSGAFVCFLIAKIAFGRMYSLALFSLILALIFIWVALVRQINSIAAYMPDSLRRTVHWIHAQTLEFFALFMMYFLSLTTFVRKNRTTPSLEKNRPILLVHGYLNSGAVWGFHKKRLMKNGFGPIYTIDLGHPFQSIRSYAMKVDEKARQIAHETGSQELTLIGHSMGGLVSYYYAARLAPPDRVLRLITIGAPLRGTLVAKIGLGQCAREMEIGSKLIQEIHNAIELRHDLTFYNITTTVDALVIPYTSAIFKSVPANQFYLDDIGHVSMLTSKRVSVQLCEWLKH